jgi:hypothetical protein
MLRTIALAVLLAGSFAADAFAGETGETIALEAVLAAVEEVAPVPDYAPDGSWTLAQRRSVTAKRSGLLLGLYATHAGLQAFDGYSTTLALGRGAREANPLLQGATGNPIALWGVKAAATAVPMLLAERLWRRNNRAAAIAVMVVSNGVMATVAARNAHVLGRQQ